MGEDRNKEQLHITARETEQRLAQEQIRRLNEELALRLGELATAIQELRRSNRDLEQFADVISHDLQEPLRTVGSFARLLQRRYGDRLDADARDFIGTIVEGVARIQEMIDDLLDLSRLTTQARPFEPVGLEDLLARALAGLRTAIAESGAVITHDPLPVVFADPAQMLQLFQNLVGNAVKFRDTVAPQIHVAATEREREWLLAVCDNGIGIAPEDRERIFLIFQRLHNRECYPGTGMGLAICRKIMEHHDGRIWVESTPGAGSTFFFTIPKKSGPA